MFKLIKRIWNYLVTGGRVKFDQNADPTIQLEQAIEEAQGQHNRAVEAAANVIASQKQTQKTLDRAHDDLDHVRENTQRALILQDQALKSGNTADAAKYGASAQSFATRLTADEAHVAQLEAQLLEDTKGADQAKQMIRRNAVALQNKLTEKEKLLSTLDRAKMQERYNDAQKALTATIGEDVPSFDEIARKIDARAAKAEGVGELMGSSVESATLEVEQASLDAEADRRLDAMRVQMGLKAPSAIDNIVDAQVIPDSAEGAESRVTGTESKN